MAVKAQEWLDRGRLATSPIDTFADYWRGFNNLYATAAIGDERQKRQWFLSKAISPSTAAKILGSHADQVTYLLSRPVIDMRGNGRDTGPFIEAFGAAKEPLEKLINLFKIIYQVRCNLEHGQKSPTRDRDLKLCEASAPLVSAVLQSCA
jgi:hypothetical protein